MRSCLLLFIAKLTLLVTIGVPNAHAQEIPEFKWGNINKSDFEITTFKGAAVPAIILLDEGKAECTFDPDAFKPIELSKKFHRRIKINSEEGLDAANLSILLFKGESESESLSGFKAVCYNLEGFTIAEKKLEKEDILTEAYGDFLVRKKINIPGVKVGSILEFSYELNSYSMSNMEEWAFQSEYPVLWSKYTMVMPNVFEFMSVMQGSNPLYARKAQTVANTYKIRGKMTGSSEMRTWVMKDVPALKEEIFSNAGVNLAAGISFQLAAINFPDKRELILPTWIKYGNELRASTAYLGAVSVKNKAVETKVKELIAGVADTAERAHKIYYFVRDRYKCASDKSIYCKRTLDEVLATTEATSAEINLLLTKMLKSAGITANPVLLSLQGRKPFISEYPVRSRINYMVVQTEVEGKRCYLDASHGKLGFGLLPHKVYHGQARIVNGAMEEVFFNPEANKESEVVLFDLKMEPDANLSGSLRCKLGNNASLEMRNTLQQEGKPVVLKKMFNDRRDDFIVDGLAFVKENETEAPLEIEGKITYRTEKNNNLVYLNLFTLADFKENPFTAPVRENPVEFGFSHEMMYMINIEIPENYEVDELPGNSTIKLNENAGFFSCKAAQEGNKLQVKTSFKLNKCSYTIEEYSELKAFFSLVAERYSSPIVLKKKS